MAQIALPIVAFLGKIGEYLAAPIGRQLGYLFCFNSNVETLKDQVEKLTTMRDGVQLQVDAAARNVETIEPEVTAWLDTVNEIRTETERIIELKDEIQKGCLNEWCLNFKSRYSESKKAKKKTQAVVELQRDGKFGKVSCPAPPPRIESTFTSTFKEFESQVSTMNEIIMILKDDRFNMIGVWGMGGVGKTTMVKEVAKRVMEENLFDGFAMTVVSQEPEFTKMQNDVAEMLGLKLEEQNRMVRAGRLRERIEGKRILIILDDVWAELDLVDLGISLQGGDKGCKIIFTSRNWGLWRELQTKIEIPLQLLSNEEAWHLFKVKAGGDSLDDPDLQPIAKQIVMECGRLPIALVTIGGALRNKGKCVWKDTLRQLGKPCGENILSGVPAKVYQILKVSYDYLADEEAKSLFLLCCLFEEDYDIPSEDLVRYGMGLRLFRGINELREARDRVFVLLDELRSSNLLLDGKKGKPVYDEQYVKMHDVVRDVAISIAAKDKRVFVFSHGVKLTEWPKDMHEHYTCISVISKEISELPVGLRSREVELLRSTDRVIETPDSFFEGMGELKVVDVRCTYNILGGRIGDKFQMMPHVPSTLPFLKSLRTLSLEKCKLKNISVIGDLLDLEILSIRDSGIEELPEAIGRLAKLRLLDVTECEFLYRIPPGVISSLVQLEELTMRGTSFNNWEGDYGEGINASLKEFESLPNLNTLEIKIRDAALLPRIPLFSKLAKYTILIGNYYRWPEGCGFQKYLKLDLGTFTPSECEISSLLKSTEYLYLEREGSKDAVHELFREGVEGLQHLKYLSISYCNTLECLANTMGWVQPTTSTPTVSLLLESFYLFDLPNLREIFHSPLTTWSFGKLTILQVWFCKKLKNVFPLSIARGLMQLKRLRIQNCEMMEEVIWKERGDDGNVINSNIIEFPKLEYMELRLLPGLTSFCRGIDEIKFPQLKELHLKRLPNFKCVVPNKSNLSSDPEENHNDTFISIFPQKVTFPNLEVLELDHLDNLEGLGLENVFELKGNDRDLEMLSPLKSLQLTRLPKLNHIAKRDPIGFSVLDVLACDSLRYLFSPNMKTSIQQLQKLTIGGCKMMSSIVAKENGEGESSEDNIEFSRLKTLCLYDMPKLVSFFSEVTTITTASNDRLQRPVQPLFNKKVSFPSLEGLRLDRLPGVNEIWCSQPPTGSFYNLIHLSVRSCGSLRNLLSPFMARNLVHLQKLSIDFCSTMEEVVAKEEDEEKGRINGTMFSKLKSLDLRWLLALKSFCNVTYHWELPLVEHIRALDCPKMETFSPGFVRTPNLQHVEWEVWGSRKGTSWNGNLNDIILYNYEKHGQKEEEKEEERRRRRRKRKRSS